ncbi:hypothetical protein [Rubrivirga sp. SAORIC476]|uniref:hypothetical protein n=1 Tax=Rubrivirga sp. SAORIC476 TaxID=1961794 RepID=UPI00117A0B3C|nr:hypothetical protein [Rubrivirga sp. SAORIC476]
MRPDALPVRPLASRAVLPPDAVAALFGPGATLRPSATAEVVRLGEAVGRVAVETGAALALWVDATDAIAGAASLRGPVGAIGPVTAKSVRSRLVLPDGLRRAWGIGDVATVGLGPLAVGLPVETGPEVRIEAERALWLAADRPETARWMPGVNLAPAPSEPDAEAGVVVIERRVVTETDVRQARLKHRRIRLTPGQIVTPAAQTLGREAGIFVG